MQLDLTIDAAEIATVEAIKAFEQSGCLKLANFIAPEALAALKDAAVRAVDTAPRPLTVGTARHMVPMPVSGVLECPELYDAPQLRKFLSSVLGPDHVLNCLTCVSAKAGAPEQHVHRDYDGLFGDRIDMFCPSFAINVFVPLVPFNSTNGSTRLWPGSHRKPETACAEAEDGSIEAELELGSALLLDYRVRHGGTANRSKQDRPMICLAYSRDWFLDTQNFPDVEPLQVDAGAFERMDEAQRQLFSRAAIVPLSDPI